MQRHPYQMAVDAAYTRERVAAQVDACRGIRANVPPRAKTESGMFAARRAIGTWLIGVGERLTDSRQAETPPAWFAR